MTNVQYGGSGFIGCENDDPSAQLLAECLDLSGLAQSDVNPWNAYPWFLVDQGNVTVARMNAGLEPLRRVLALMLDARCVVTFGKIAHDSWRRFGDRFSGDASRVQHLQTFHTSGRGITNGGRQRKSVGVEHVVTTLRAARSAAGL